MQSRVLPLLFVVFTIFALVGAVFLLFNGESGQDVLSGQGVAEYSTGDAPVEMEGPSRPEAGPERVALAGGGVPEDPDAMPASYRAALGALIGRVVEPDGAPVASVAVEVFEADALDILVDSSWVMADEPPPFEFRTDKTQTAEDGTFRFAGMYPRSFQALGVDLGGARPTSRLIDHVPGPGETVDLGDIVLSPCAVLTGRVLETSDAPVAGARVRATQLPPVIFLSGIQDYRDGCSFLVRFGEQSDVIEPPAMLQQFYRLMPFPSATTAADGTFRLDGVPFGPVTLVVDRPGFVTSIKPAIAPARGGERSVGDVYVDRGARLAGKVVDALGEPASGIEVRVGPMQGVAEFIVLQAPVFSGADGAFAYDGAAPMPFFAAARRYPQDPWTIVGPFDPELEPPTLTLPPAYDLRVKVFDGEGALASGARLRIRQFKDYMNFLPVNPPVDAGERMETPEAGVFVVRGLAPGTYDLVVAAPGHGVVKETVDIRAEAAVKEIYLETAYKAFVRVLADKSKTPVEWATVHASPGRESWWFNPTRLSRTRTGAGGLAAFDNLGPGDYLVSVSHPQFAVTDAELHVPAEGELVVLLKPGGVLEGVVHRGGSTHEAPYMVSVSARFGGDEAAPEALTPRLAATDHEGNFRVANLNPGSWEVNVMKRLLDQEPLGLTEVLRLGPLMSSDVEIFSGETSYVEINLSAQETGPSANVSGRVLVDGAPAQNTLISLYAGKRLESRVNARGQYDLGEVPVGEHRLQVSELPGATGQYDFSISKSIGVVEGVPLVCDFEILTGALSGRVIYESTRQPVRAVRVTARLETEEGEVSAYTVRMSTTTGLNGEFFFDGVPVGTYSVQANDREYGCRAVTDLDVFAGGRAGPVVLAMITPTLVKGRVVLDDTVGEGRWVGLLFESADPNAPATEWVGVNRTSGEFETKKLIPGSYKVRLWGDFGEGKAGFKPMDLNVPTSGLTGLVLVPEREQPEGAGG